MKDFKKKMLFALAVLGMSGSGLLLSATEARANCDKVWIKCESDEDSVEADNQSSCGGHALIMYVDC